MSDEKDFRRLADRLLAEAAHTDNMAERGRLIDQALHWHNLAMEAAGHGDLRLHDNDEDGDAEGSLSASG
ncbi:MAG: hypothetical protein ACJ798_10015 [Phenylobacterium sp.]